MRGCAERDRAVPGVVYAPVLLVLGPVEVRDGRGAEVALGGVRPRRLLAGLALQAGEVVSADRLAGIVWGDRPPRSARQNLNTYLWSLRRRLAAATGGQVTVETRPAGYVLRAGPGVLDWHCFRDLAATAAGIAESDPAAAAVLLRQALGLWRGPAAAGLDEGPPELAARAAAMDEARLAALEQRIEADLAAGRHRGLTAELAELTAAHPLREQFRAHQMLALYRCGRQAEALSAFHQLRRDLAGELGIDPSPPLGALYQAILRADPFVGWPPPAAGGAAPIRPDTPHLAAPAAGDRGMAEPARPGRPASRTGLLAAANPRAGAAAGAERAGPRGTAAPDLPRDATLGQRAAAAEARLFQGRRAELGWMLGLLSAPELLPRVVQLHGPAGIGKTAFACALARECATRGWPAVVLDSRDFLHDTAGLAGAVAARCAGVWSPSSGRPLLLVLDTAEEMRDLEHGLWEVVLPGLKGPVLVVLAGRRPTPILARSGHWHGLVGDLELRGLSDGESRRLVRLHGVRDPGTTREILAFARGNPLFVAVAAQHARSAGAARWQPSGAVTRSLIGRMTREISDPGVRELLEAASLVCTFNQELLAAMTGRDVHGPFDALCGLSVVRAVPAGRRLHDLVRESVAADLRWRAPQACQQMTQRAYAYLAQQATTARDPGPWIQELLRLGTSPPAQARFFAPAGPPGVHVRPATPDDLPRLTELCHTGITRFGLPPAHRASQLHADFPIATRDFAVTLNDAGAITGFAYNMRLNRGTWRAAAKTREAFFAALPQPELAAIKAAPPTASQASVITGATHLPGYDHLGAVLRQALFPRAHDRHTLTANFTAYHLLTPNCPELPEITAAGHSRRTRNINLAGCLVDEWLLNFGDGGLIGWIGELLQTSPASPTPPGPARELPELIRSVLPGPAGRPCPIAGSRSHL